VALAPEPNLGREVFSGLAASAVYFVISKYFRGFFHDSAEDFAAFAFGEVAGDGFFGDFVGWAGFEIEFFAAAVDEKITIAYAGVKFEIF